LSRPLDAFQPHPPGDRVDRVVAAHVLDEGEDLGAVRERAAVHRARLLVDRLVHAHCVEQTEERLLVDAHVVVELIDSMSAIRSPNTVPWPQPVVAVRFSVLRPGP
jgi:hypothetical protein